MRWGVTAATLVTCLVATAPGAGAAQTFGSNLASAASTCIDPAPGSVVTSATTTLPAANTAPGGLTSPMDGVIVFWRVKAAPFAPGAGLAPLTPQVIRPGASGVATSAATGETVTPALGTTNVFPARLPVRAGDGFGVRFGESPGALCRAATSGAVSHMWIPALVDGEPPRGGLAEMDPRENLINADVEPDADGDGFGDETQDACPGDPALQEAPCDRLAPDSAITGGPKDKTKKKTATFTFSGTDVRAIAGFQCSLDGAQFTPCTSPVTVKVKKGKHTFSVRATDLDGNVDGTPATDSWKVKKKKKKRKG